MSDKPIPIRQTDEGEFIAYVHDSVMRRIECKVVQSSDARSLERRRLRAVEAELDNALETRAIAFFERDQARRERDEFKRDAERLDWMEKNVSAIRDIGWVGGDLRTAIDAAGKEKP